MSQEQGEHKRQSSNISSSNYNVKNLHVQSVVVYMDRAEVRRTFKCSVKAGQNEISVYNLPGCIDPDSIRVEGRGNAAITEVTYLTKREERSEDHQESELSKNIREQVKHLRKLEGERRRASKRRDIIKGLGDQLTPDTTWKRGPISSDVTYVQGSDEKDTIARHLLSGEGVDGVHDFLSMYTKELETLDGEIFKLDDEIIHTTERLAVLRGQRSHDYDHEDSNLQVTRRVAIYLDSKANAEVELFLSYLVSGASWEPKYDIRAYLQEELVKVTYFGLIKQQTGEDWIDAKIFLSTSRPSSGGDIPSLNTKVINFTPATNKDPNSKTAKVAQFVKNRIEKSEDAKESPGPDGVFASDAQGQKSHGLKGKLDVVKDMAKDMIHGGQTPPTNTQAAMEKGKEVLRGVAESSAQDKLHAKAGGLSTSYEIARRTSIPSDDTEHKVTVAMFDLKPHFEHIIVPSVMEAAFLMARMTNASPYLLLGGPTSVFVDNNFITKGTLETVSPAEIFDCSLGVDAAVRVDFRPCEKHNEASGVFSKSPMTRYKQSTEIKNTHQRSIFVQVEEQLPRSGDEKIKVNLVAPHLPKEKEREREDARDLPINLNDRNNVVWRQNIAAGASETFLLHYTIEKPKESRDLMFEYENYN